MLGLSVLQLITAVFVGVIYTIWCWTLCFRPELVAKLPGSVTSGNLEAGVPLALYWATMYTIFTCLGVVAGGVVLGLIALLLLQILWIDIPALLKAISSWPW